MRIIAGQYKNRIIQAPKGLEVRPTSGRLREALFNICQSDNIEARFLDLFAGSGAMGLEALSRGANSVVFVDNSRESIRAIKANLLLLQAEKQAEAIYGDALEVLGKLASRGKCFDIIYADPPYAKIKQNPDLVSYSTRVLQIVDAHISLLAAEGSLFLEDAEGSLPENEALQHLVLKSSRNFGRSALQHYVRKH